MLEDRGSLVRHASGRSRQLPAFAVDGENICGTNRNDDSHSGHHKMATLVEHGCGLPKSIRSFYNKALLFLTMWE